VGDHPLYLHACVRGCDFGYGLAEEIRSLTLDSITRFGVRWPLWIVLWRKCNRPSGVEVGECDRSALLCPILQN
jgi:hypothetical protein